MHEFVLTWYCVSPEGCEREEDVLRIDRVTVSEYFHLHFTSTHDEAFGEDAQMISSDSLGVRCYSLQFLSLLGHELEPSRLCIVPGGGFDVELSIPNQDPATHSEWVVSARDP